MRPWNIRDEERRACGSRSLWDGRALGEMRRVPSGANADANPPVDVPQLEFYEIDENAPVPKLGNQDGDLLRRPGGLSPIEQVNFDQLNARLEKLLAPEPHLPSNASYSGCPGDGNLDLVVNAADWENWRIFAEDGHSIWYDFNLDGKTNRADLRIIEKNFGTDCRKRR